MMKRGIVLSITCVLLAGAAPAPQATEGVAWAASWEDAKAEAVERNVPIFFTVQQDENPGCKQMEGAFRDASFITASRKVVCVVSNPDTKHGIRETMVNKEKVPFCRAYDGMRCEVHMRCQQALSNFIKDGDFDIPMQIWCRPDGKELFKFSGPNGSGTQSPAALVKDLDRAMERVSGPKLTRREWEDLKRLLNEGDNAQGKMEWKLSLAIFKKVSDSKNERFSKLGKDRYDNVVHQGVAIVKRAVAQYEKAPPDSKEHKEVKPMLQKIAKEMKGTEAGDAAEKALKEVVK